MEANDKLLFEISDLVIKGFDNSLCDDEFNSLQNLLRNHPLAAEYYCDLMATIAHMDVIKELDFGSMPEDINDLLRQIAEDAKTAPAIKIPGGKSDRELIQKVVFPPREKHKMSRFDKFILVASAAMVLLFVYLSFAPERKILPIAKVSDGVEAEWLSASGQIAVGSDLYPGPLALKKGVAQIVLKGGARILLEAPVEVDLETPSSIYLERGRLVVNIEQSTEDRFVVRTANSTLVDYGTEFGAQVGQAGQLYTHVFNGKVELRQGSDPLKYGSNLRLEAGQSGRATSSGELARVADEPPQFFRTMPTRYELAVKKTRPLYYWRFDRNPDGILLNAPDSNLNDAYQLIGLTGYTQGPDLGGSQSNTALQLNGGEDYAILRDCTADADNADSFTIAMWVRPEIHEAMVTSKAGKVILRVRRKDETGMGHRSTLLFDCNKKQFVFYVGHTSQNPEGLANEFDTSVSSGAVELNTWHHVVVSYTNSDRKMNLYVNGRLNASKILPDAVRLLDIGNNAEPYRWLVGYGKTVQSEDITEGNNFTGSVDEISQYNRQLSADEVRMLYEAAEGRSNN
jgi:hypothetical protein